MCALIGARTLDFVTLERRDGGMLKRMAVDDNGYRTEEVEHSPTHTELRPMEALRPLNAKATALYHGVCLPGTTHQIVGDVAIFEDSIG